MTRHTSKFTSAIGTNGCAMHADWLKNLTLNALRHTVKNFCFSPIKTVRVVGCPSLHSLRWLLEDVTRSRSRRRRNLTAATSTSKRSVGNWNQSGSCYDACSSSTRTGPSTSRWDSIPLATASPWWNSEPSREIRRPSSSSPISTSRRMKE